MISAKPLRKVLVVDSQADWRERLAHLLGSDFALTCKESYALAHQAIEQSQEAPFHVVITEIRLDETQDIEEGFTLAEEINARGEHTQVIFLSRYTSSENTEFVRTAYKDLDAFRYEEKTPSKTEGEEGKDFLNKVREAAEEANSRRNIFVAMPFAKEFDPFYEQVKEIVAELGIQCARADDVFRTGVVVEHIQKCIQGAKIVIADLSGNNPNVHFEVGLAHAKGKSVLLLTRSSSEPSKKLLGNLRNLEYEDSAAGVERLRRDLSRAIKDIQSNDYPADFKKSDRKPNPLMCCALQPEGEDGKDTFERIVQPAASSAGFTQCLPLQNIYPERILLRTIWEQINQASLVVTDLSGKNSDICYLAGQTYGLNKPGIVIAQKGEVLPFDFLAGKPLFFTKRLQKDCDEARQELAEAMRALGLTQVPKKKVISMPALPPPEVVILAVLPEEYDAVCKQFSALYPPPGLSGTNLYAWQAGLVECEKHNRPYSVVVGMTGRAGANQSALAVSNAIHSWTPRYVFFVGIAGGLAGLQKGGVVIADTIYGYEYGKLSVKYDPRSNWFYTTDQGLLTGTLAYALHQEWRTRILANPPAACDPTVYSGEIASGDKVVDNPKNTFFKQVLRRWPKLIAVEMEGAGAGAAIQHAQAEGKAVGFMMIRGISDLPRPPQPAETQGTQERDNWKPYASATAAAFTIGYIASGLPEPPRNR